MNSESKSSESNSGSSSKASMGSVIGKFLLLIIILVLGAAGVLYAVGGNEIEIVVSQEFKGEKGQTFRLTGRVYRCITDPELVTKWVEGIKKIEPKGDIKEHKVGAKSTITVESEGTEIVFEDEVVSARVNQGTEIKMTSENMDVVQNFEISYKDKAALSGDTIVLTQTFKVKFKGMMRLFAVFSKSAMEEQLKKNLASLKKLVDEGAGEPVRRRPNRGPNRGGKGKGKGGKGKGGKGPGDKKGESKKKEDAEKKKEESK